jgi:hypothetical protein
MQVIATGTRPAGAPGPALGSRPGPMLRGPAAMPLPASQRPPGPAGAFNDRQFTGTCYYVRSCQWRAICPAIWARRRTVTVPKGPSDEDAELQVEALRRCCRGHSDDHAIRRTMPPNFEDTAVIAVNSL